MVGCWRLQEFGGQSWSQTHALHLLQVSQAPTNKENPDATHLFDAPIVPKVVAIGQHLRAPQTREHNSSSSETKGGDSLP